MQNLTKNLVNRRILENEKIIQAFQSVDRQNFVTKKYLDLAHEDIALPIGYGQTISQPSTVAFMLEMLQAKPGQKIMEIGSGSGWVVALLANIVGSKGKIFGIEMVPELVEFGQKNLRKYNYPNTQIIRAKEKLGLPEEAPFDAILVSASGASLPHELIKQLKIDGTLLIPIEDSIYKIKKKSETKLATQKFPGFAFVPLIK